MRGLFTLATSLAVAFSAHAADERECTPSLEAASAELLEKYCSGPDLKPHVFYIKGLNKALQPAFLACNPKQVYYPCHDVCGWLEKMMDYSKTVIADGIYSLDEDHNKTLIETRAAYKDLCHPVVSGRLTPMMQASLK